MILIIDNYDSFTYNLYQYLCELGADVDVVRNDAVTVADIRRMAPEAIVMMAQEGHAATADEVFRHPALAATPAAAAKWLVVMDGLYLLGFGPRTADAARELARQLHPGLAAEPSAR